MNLAVNRRILEYSYTKLLTGSESIFQTIRQKIGELEKRVDSLTLILTASQALTEQEQQELKGELAEDLDINIKSLKNFDVENMYIAKRMLEEAGDEQIGSQEIRRTILREIFQYLKNNRKFSRPQISAVLKDVKERITRMIEKRDQGGKQVELLNFEPQKRQAIIEELLQLGLSKEFIDEIDFRNLYIAKTIVEEYDFGRVLRPEEKRCLIMSILDSSVVMSKPNNSLNRLLRRLRDYGFNTQDANGIIINLGVYGTVLNGHKGCRYRNLLKNEETANRIIKEYSENENGCISIGKVTPISIIIALSKHLKEDEETRIIERLQNELGINGEFLASKRIENVFIATQIVDGYEFERPLENEEKSALIQSILKSTLFDKGKKEKVATFLRKFEQLGFDQQQVYGLMINLFVNALRVDGVEHTYPDFFGNNVLWDRLKEQQDYMPTNVNDITIKKAQREVEESHQKAQKTMRTATNRWARKGREGARRDLIGLNLISPEEQHKLGEEIKGVKGE